MRRGKGSNRRNKVIGKRVVMEEGLYKLYYISLDTFCEVGGFGVVVDWRVFGGKGKAKGYYGLCLGVWVLFLVNEISFRRV